MSNVDPRTTAPPVTPPIGTPPATPEPDVVVVGTPDATTDSGSDKGTTDKGKEVAGTAKEEGKQVAGQAADQGKQVAATAAEGAKDVVGEAKREATDVARTAQDEARRMFGEATGELRTQADSQTDRLAGGLRTVSSQLQAAASGKPLDEGMVRDLAEQAGARVNDIAERLSSGGIDGVVDDVTRFARRRPGLFLASAGAAGFLAGRLLRGAQADAKDDGPSGTRTAGSRTTTVVPDVAPDLQGPGTAGVAGDVVLQDAPGTAGMTVPPGTLPAGPDDSIGTR